jgi:excisionase family DNA binding protein
LLTPAQVAEHLQFSERTVVDWLRSGLLPGVKLGNRWRVDEEELRQVLDARARFMDDERTRPLA